MPAVNTPTLAAASCIAAIIIVAVRFRPKAIRTASPDIGSNRRRPFPRRRWQRRHRASPSANAVAEWCDALGRALRSGSTMREALSTIEPIDDPTRRATEQLRLQLDRGRTVLDAAALDGPAGPHLALALSIIATTTRLGGSGALAIDQTASTLRLRGADHSERLAQAAQARLSAHVLTAVPLGMLALLLFSDPDVRQVASQPVGVVCIGLGLTANAAGALWMRHIVGTAG